MTTVTMDLCANETSASVRDASPRPGEIAFMNSMYIYFCPALIFMSFVSVVINAALVIVGHVYVHRKTPVLLLSLNLASTDTLASLLTGVGFLFNSYLPIVFQIHLSRCLFLAYEIVRTSALIASALHLLGLAYIHYKGTINPLHYRSISFCSQNVTRSIHCITLCCWILPLSSFTIYFFSVPCQAFLSQSCRIEFFLTKKYRLFLLLIFLTPLLLMLFIYIRIFVAIKQNDRRRQKLSLGHHSSRSRSTKASLIQMRWYKKVVRLSLDSPSIATEITTNDSFLTRPEVDCAESTDGSACTSARDSPESVRVVNRIRTHSKALCTTLLILGTYLFCWMPAVVFLALTCRDGCPFPIDDVSTVSRVVISFSCNSLVVLKAIVDPFIYTLRMKDVKDAIRRARGK